MAVCRQQPGRAVGCLMPLARLQPPLAVTHAAPKTCVARLTAPALPANAKSLASADGERSPSSTHRRRLQLCQFSEGSTEPDVDDGAEDFYAIMGVAPGANEKEIKAAYYRIMRACHPDIVVSLDEEDDGSEAQEVCVFVNDIYETLMDAEKRAAYDAIAGFSGGAINPFYDRSYERNQVFVSEYDCIGCKNCTHVCPNTFAIEDDYGRARAMEQGAHTDELLQEAIDTCPVNCIHWVTSPQLALLEDTMRKMERVDAYILMMGGGGGVDVFNEAAIAWEKRQARIRAKREESKQAAAKRGGWMSWGQPSAGASSYSGDGNAAASGKAQEAASATAAAARRWRDFQRSRQKASVAGQLPQHK